MPDLKARLCFLGTLALAVAGLGLAGCDRQPATEPATVPASPPAAQTAPSVGDLYDTAKMDFKPGPAKLSSERHTGPFAIGDALNMDVTLKPLTPEPVKEIRLDTTHKIIEIAPGVKFSAWTFGNQVPGPVVRARVGDRIKFSMTNRSDEPAPGVQVIAAPMMHSMDFHSAMVSPQDKYRSVAPGQTISFEFTANYPGVYMYHCGTPMVLEHIASGMYGMMIVEPRNGYPTKVDREYAVIQSEFYTKLDPQKRKIDGQPLYVLDGERVRTKAPTYTVFNGRYNGFVDKPLPAKPGERVRLFVLNVGPSNTSSFHVVGTIFDRVWMEGNPDNQVRGAQTVLLGSSNAAIVEFVVPEAGNYVIVDHHFANASQGAIGLIGAGAPAGASETEHHNIPATAAPSDPAAVKGKLAFESTCLACHSIGGGDKLGPDLYGVSKRRNDAWLAKWLRSPEQLLQTDADAKTMLDKYKLPMPNQNLSDGEIRGFVTYFKWADTNLRPQGKEQPQPAAPGAALPPNKTLSGSPGEVNPTMSGGSSAGQRRRTKRRKGRREVMKRALILIATSIATGATSASWACGACVEDRVAATYDHAVIGTAIAKHQQVVFVAVDGPTSAEKIDARIIAAASKVRGVKAATLRTSIAPQAFSFALDAAQDPKTTVAGFRKAIGDSSARLALVRIMRDGALIEPK